MTPSELIAKRKALGLSQEALGAMIGRNKRQIIRWEKGDSPIPPLVDLALAGAKPKAKA